VPKNGWNAAGVTAPAYPLGTKIMGYTDNSHCPGWYTMYYGNLAAISGTNYGISADFSDGKCWCMHCCLTVDADSDATYKIALNDGTYQPAYVVHQCGTDQVTDATVGGGACLPCVTLDPYEYGWFWVGGVCPCKDVTIMDESDSGIGVDMTTLGDVERASLFLCITAKTALLTCDFSQVTSFTCRGLGDEEGQLAAPIGWSMAPDA